MLLARRLRFQESCTRIMKLRHKTEFGQDALASALDRKAIYRRSTEDGKRIIKNHAKRSKAYLNATV